MIKTMNEDKIKMFFEIKWKYSTVLAVQKKLRSWVQNESNTKSSSNKEISLDKYKSLKNALYGDSDNTDLICQIGKNKVLKRSIKKLRRTEWLNDEIINTYFELLMNLSENENRKNNIDKGVCIFFNFHFFSKALSSEEVQNKTFYDDYDLVKIG